MKKLISPGCGFCLYEKSCQKKLDMRAQYEKDKKNEKNIYGSALWAGIIKSARSKHFYKSHSCKSFEVDPNVGKSKSELMTMFNK